MKTIAVEERTFHLLRELKSKMKADSFNQLLLDLVINEEQVPKSLFGSLKGKTKSFTSKERKRIWKDKER